MARLRQLLTVGVVTAAASFVACGVFEGTHDPHFVPDGYDAYSSKQYDFGVAYPEGWVARPHDSVPLEVFAPQDFAVEIHISRRDLVESTDTQSFVDLLRRNDSGTSSEPIPLEVDGEPALQFRNDGEQPSIVIVFVEAGTPWVLSLTTLLGESGDLTEFEPVFEQMLATFRRD